MPLYEYQCEACRQRFELIQKFSDPAPEACPKCGKGPVERQLSSPAIQFKGSGWYITDYARKGGNSGADTGSKSSDAPSAGDSGGESKKSETKKTEAAASSTAASSASDKS
jgi:putative FmdB family regulatory protein